VCVYQGIKDINIKSISIWICSNDITTYNLASEDTLSRHHEVFKDSINSTFLGLLCKMDSGSATTLLFNHYLRYLRKLSESIYYVVPIMSSLPVIYGMFRQVCDNLIIYNLLHVF
jgi:hypothetical protein